MDGSRRRRRDLGSAEMMSNTSIRMYECRTLLASTFKAAKRTKRPCAVLNGQSATVQDYELQALAHSASKVTSLDLSVVNLGSVESCNVTKVGYCLRKTRARLASADEALVMSPKDNEAEILNGTSKIHSCLEAINFDFPNEKLPESNAYYELMVSARNPMAGEPLPSAESSNRQRSSQMRASALFDSISKHPKDAMPNMNVDNTQLGRLKPKVSPIQEKRNRKGVAVFETESTSENKGSTNGDGSDLEDSSRKRVKWIRHMFRLIYDRLSYEVKLTRKNDSRRIRVDLMTLKHLKENNLELHFGSIPLGQVPGVEVGDEFHLRAELFMLGLHRQLQGGIDYFKHDGRLLARSIISSGSSRYSDKVGNSQVLIYSGSGTPEKDQKLEYGNLALKNSIDAQNPIRVIRGFEETQISTFKSSKGRKAMRYIYDGLYLAEKFWTKKNDNGFNVIMFQLRRMQEQPELRVKQVRLRTSITFSDICIEDIASGKEKTPIPVVNTIDEDSPLSFTYSKEMIYPPKYFSTPSKGCECIGGCTDSIKCACAVKNGGELPFNGRGAIVQAKPLVYECGPSCKCPPTCHNRVSQHGIKFPLEVFKTRSMGWGVRSLSLISSGSFVCEYVGELLKDEDAQKRTNDEYLFAIGNNYYDAALWEGLPNSIPELQKSRSSEEVNELNYTVDASNFGNVARFINHSCTPNLYAQNLLYDHGDKSMPHIMLFASEDIPPLQELTYHYNYTIDQVYDSNGDIKQKICLCGSIECTGRLY